MNCLAGRTSTQNKRQQEKNISLPLRTVHDELLREENFTEVKDTKRKKLSLLLSTVHDELLREENFTAKWKTQQEKNISLPLRTVHDELLREENFTEVKDTKRKKLSLLLRTVHDELLREENFNAKWKTRRREILKSPLENSPQWTASWGELQPELKDTKRKSIEVSPWEQSTVNCLASRTSTRNERHEDDKARNHSNVRTFLVRNCYEPCFKSSPDGARIEDGRRSTFLHPCNLQLNASPKSVCIMNN